MTKKSKIAEFQVQRAIDQSPYAGRTARHGWHLVGPGPARYGWAAVSAAGAVAWLGVDTSSAVALLADL